MLNRFRFSLQLFIVFCFVTGGFMISGARTARGKWKVLFNGKSTDAWRGYNQTEFPGDVWKVENGVLRALPNVHGVDLITKDQYDNFELTLEWKISPSGNSGIIYRVAESSDPSYYSGPEMQILDDSKNKDKPENTLAGSLYDLIAPQNKILMPVGQFNKARLLVQGNHVEHWLNGMKVVEYELGSRQLQDLIAGSKFKDMPNFARIPKGYLALQYHNSEVFFRNIRIRELPIK
ncbi:MAG: 3-keto-disaccharide hydrolase [Pyrinomonadaceae bacterium]